MMFGLFEVLSALNNHVISNSGDSFAELCDLLNYLCHHAYDAEQNGFDSFSAEITRIILEKLGPHNIYLYITPFRHVITYLSEKYSSHSEDGYILYCFAPDDEHYAEVVCNPGYTHIFLDSSRIATKIMGTFTNTFTANQLLKDSDFMESS